MEKGILFQIPFMVHQVSEWKNVKDEFLSSIDFNDPDCMNDDMYTDFIKYYAQLKKPPYHNDLLNLLDEPIQFFCENYPSTNAYYESQDQALGNPESRVPIEVYSSWCQKYSAGQMHPLHNHSIYGWSAVFYAQLDKSHEATNFFSPFVDPWNGFPEEITPAMNEGDIIFFPSLLMHQSLPHKGTKDRIIFSFNLNLSLTR